jgi:hypothetical protein
MSAKGRIRLAQRGAAGDISTAASGVVISTAGFSELAMVMIALRILGWKPTLY